VDLRLAGRLADPERGPAGSGCGMERALTVLGRRSALVLMREAAYGTSRFEDFTRRSGFTEAVVSTRLRELVGAGLLTTEPYRDEGQRTRRGYALTAAGRDLVPVLVALTAWGQEHMPHRGVVLTHEGCGAAIRSDLTCAAGHPVNDDEICASA
jgi:DNA-binding HxlR family transcriptional regulator